MKGLTKNMIDAIRYGTESRRWEFKPPFAWNNNQRKRKAELTRAALALSNISNGGFVVIGIFQKRDRTNGIVFERRGLTSRQFASFNSADDIARFFNSKSNQVIKFEIFGGEVNFEAINKKFVVIQILESRSFIPVVCIKDFKPRERHCRLVKDTIYIRPISDPIESRAISSKEEWEEMILRLLVHKEEILHKDLISICRSITKKGKVVKPTKKISSQAQNKYDKVLKRDKLK